MLNPNPSSCSSNLIFLFSCLHSGILSLFEHVMSSLSKERPKDSKLSKTCQWFDPTHFNWTNFWELSTWIEIFPPGKSNVVTREGWLITCLTGRLHPGRKGCQISKLLEAGCGTPTKCSTEISPKTQRYQIRFETVTKKTPKKKSTVWQTKP